MNLLALRTEVLNHGFDPIQYSARINQYLNDAQNLICRRVGFLVEESTQMYATTGGTATLALPEPTYDSNGNPSGGFARVRELFNADLNVALEGVGLHDIDQSAVAQGQPCFYALDGKNIRLYPTPDGVYNLELRYWQMPTALVNDTDVSSLPADWHFLLWEFAVFRCYRGDDDAQMSQFWWGEFTRDLAMFEADQKFPSTDFPTRANGMWEDGRTLTPSGSAWTLYGGY